LVDSCKVSLVNRDLLMPAFLTNTLTSVPGLGYSLYNFYRLLRSYQYFVDSKAFSMLGITSPLGFRFMLNDPHFNAKLGESSDFFGLTDFSTYRYNVTTYG